MSLRIRNRVRVNAQGKKLYKFINCIHDNGIECSEQYCRGNIFRCDILKKDMKKLKILAEECGIELKYAEYHSLAAKLSRYRKRAGLFIGIILAAVTVLYFSQVVVTIEIQGNTSVSDEVILSALKELDIKAGTPLFRLDLRTSEKKLKAMLDNVAWAGIRHTGSRIVVQIHEAAPIPEISRERIPCNIVASRDAVISSVLVKSGELRHIVGDYVPKGTLLISGVAENDKGQTFVYHAMGEIRGTYEEEVSFSAPFHTQELLPTGKTRKLRRLKLFSLDIPLYFFGNDYTDSRTEKSVSKLKIFGKELPLGIEENTFTEMYAQGFDRNEDELYQHLMERVYLYENNFLDNDTIILSRSVNTSRTDDTLTLTVKYSLESNICQQNDIFIK